MWCYCYYAGDDWQSVHIRKIQETGMWKICRTEKEVIIGSFLEPNVIVQTGPKTTQKNKLFDEQQKEGL